MKDGDHAGHYTSGGMTLRDYFAGQALAGLMADPTTVAASVISIAQGCYRMADAMLTQRRKSNDG